MSVDAKPNQQPNILDGCFINAKGLVTEVSFYQNTKTNKITYSFHLTTVGSSALKVSLKDGSDPSVYREKIGQVLDTKIIVRENKFGTFFEEA